MVDFTPNLQMPLLRESQANAEVTHNEALNILDAMVQTRVKDKDLTAPPGSPAEGDRYIVASVASGDWTGQEDNIAFFFGNTWNFITPLQGWRAFVEDESVEYNFNGTAWVTGGIGSGNTLLLARFNAAGSILLQTSEVGASVAVSHPSAGIYDLTFTGILVTNVYINSQLNDRLAGDKSLYIKSVTDKTSDTGAGTPTGCRVQMDELKQFSCATCLILEIDQEDGAFSIEVKEMN